MRTYFVDAQFSEDEEEMIRRKSLELDLRLAETWKLLGSILPTYWRIVQMHQYLFFGEGIHSSVPFNFTTKIMHNFYLYTQLKNTLNFYGVCSAQYSIK